MNDVERWADTPENRAREIADIQAWQEQEAARKAHEAAHPEIYGVSQPLGVFTPRIADQ
jgi:hypothetical protein